MFKSEEDTSAPGARGLGGDLQSKEVPELADTEGDEKSTKPGAEGEAEPSRQPEEKNGR